MAVILWSLRHFHLCGLYVCISHRAARWCAAWCYPWLISTPFNPKQTGFPRTCLKSTFKSRCSKRTGGSHSRLDHVSGLVLSYSNSFTQVTVRKWRERKKNVSNKSSSQWPLDQKASQAYMNIFISAEKCALYYFFWNTPLMRRKVERKQECSVY